MTLQQKIDRSVRANQFLAVIAGCGRCFFSHDGHVATFWLDQRGRVWYCDAYNSKRIYTHYSGNWRGFTEGGTMRGVVITVRDFITTGVPQRLDLGPWPEWLCGGDVWGYGDDMDIVRHFARDNGIAEKLCPKETP